MAAFQANRVLSGSFAEIWVDGMRIAEASGIQLTVRLIRSDVQVGMDVDSKIVGRKGEGQLRLRQVYSRFFDVVESAGAGKDLRVTITTALISWWKNNSFTPEAIEADDFLCQLKEHK